MPYPRAVDEEPKCGYISQALPTSNRQWKGPLTCLCVNRKKKRWMKLLSECNLNMCLPAHARSCPAEHGLHCAFYYMPVKRWGCETENRTRDASLLVLFFTSQYSKSNLKSFFLLLLLCIIHRSSWMQHVWVWPWATDHVSMCERMSQPSHTHFHIYTFSPFDGWWCFNQQRLMVTYLLICAFPASTPPTTPCPINAVDVSRVTILPVSMTTTCCSPLICLPLPPTLPFPFFLTLICLSSLCTLLVFQGQRGS